MWSDNIWILIVTLCFSGSIDGEEVKALLSSRTEGLLRSEDLFLDQMPSDIVGHDLTQGLVLE